jgi:hypothetical protein
VHFPVSVGDKFDLLIVTSTFGRNLDQQQALVNQAASSASEAANAAEYAAVAQAAAEAVVSDAHTQLQGYADNAASSAAASASSASDATAAAEAANAIKEEIQSVQGVVTYLDGHDFGDPADAEDWQQTLTDYALAQVPDWSSVPNSCDVVNLWDGIEWIYNIETEKWIAWGSATVTPATNEKAGIVKGNASAPGKISVGSDGEMTVNTLPPQTTKLTAPLEAGALFTVPAHAAGSGILKIYLCGLLCPLGTSAENGFYTEVDSTTIRIFEPLPAGATIPTALL